MYHIIKTKSSVKPFAVALVARSGELLSLHGLKTKQACWKNIKAQVRCNNGYRVFVQDDTLKRSIKYNWDGAYKTKLPVCSPIYVPGKNKK